MKKLIPFVVSGILVIGAVGCQETAKTNSQTPTTTNEASQPPATPASATNPSVDKTVKVPALPTLVPIPTTQTKVKIDSPKSATTKAESDLKTEVSKKLNQDLPGNKLQVENKEGEIILKGTASSVDELKKAETLAKEVQGVKMVKIEAKVEAVKKP
ncbi:BON domain-containing protein [Nostoc sp. DSM 114161]|jgi:hyperosmotically inducible protein|uniref:BON domain-containing protein n=1 Tax=Nostoc sp. DSM 114161 TaxID=3440143 RepID=UPI0040458CA8